MEQLDVQDKYFSAMQAADFELTLYASRMLSDSMSNLFASRPQPSTKWASTLPLHMIESAWKLGTWPEMDCLVNASVNNNTAVNCFGGIPNSVNSKPASAHRKFARSRSSTASERGSSSLFFVPNIGNVLLNLKEGKNTYEMDGMLNDIRNNALASLKAALLSNQLVAYHQAYLDSIIPLHFIYDVEKVCSSDFD